MEYPGSSRGPRETKERKVGEEEGRISFFRLPGHLTIITFETLIQGIDGVQNCNKTEAKQIVAEV